MENENRRDPSTSFLTRLAPYSSELFQAPMREQYAALCNRQRSKDRSVEVLMVTSRETERWIIPKGWPMKGKKPHRAAAIEALEEAGVQGNIKKKPFGYYTYLKALDDGTSIPCIVHVFLLAVEHLDLKFREKGQRSRKWMSCSDAARVVAEPELKGLFKRLDGKIKSGRRSKQLVPDVLPQAI